MTDTTEGRVPVTPGTLINKDWQVIDVCKGLKEVTIQKTFGNFEKRLLTFDEAEAELLRN